VKSDRSSGPLKGAVICLTGIDPEEKDQYHEMIVDLGGIYTRDLDVSKNTHLIAVDPVGAKYETAKTTSSIRIVQPAWLESCFGNRALIDELKYSLDLPVNMTTKEVVVSTSDSLPEALDRLLSGSLNNFPSDIFLGSLFYLLDFQEHSELLLKVGRIIRRGMGTVCWEFNDSVSHVIVNDGCDDSFRDAARTLTAQNRGSPVFVSPWWILASWRNGSQLAKPSEFEPRYESKQKSSTPVTSKEALSERIDRKTASIFRGCAFALLRVSPPPWAVDFDSDKLELSIQQHGGQMLSLKLVEAIKTDRAKGSQQRRCYVICWGGFDETHLSIHPLLAQVKRNDLCELVLASPIWFLTSIAEQKIVRVQRDTILFAPQFWPMCRLMKAPAKTIEHDQVLRISVTGFSGSQRTGLIQLINLSGATYDDSMRTHTTHLICREPSGPKYGKAIEWKIHVVTVEWLYHVMQYGYNGASKSANGCEESFRSAPVVDTSCTEDA
jgi:hypothetical protein